MRICACKQVVLSSFSLGVAQRARGHARIPLSSRGRVTLFEVGENAGHVDVGCHRSLESQHCLLSECSPQSPFGWSLQLPTLTTSSAPTPHPYAPTLTPRQPAFSFSLSSLKAWVIFPDTKSHISDSCHTPRKLPDVSLRINPTGFPCSPFLSLLPLNPSLPSLSHLGGGRRSLFMSGMNFHLQGIRAHAFGTREGSGLGQKGHVSPVRLGSWGVGLRARTSQTRSEGDSSNKRTGAS